MLDYTAPIASHGEVSHADFLAARRFDSLDGLRALSILAVIWHHTCAVAFAGGPLGHIGAEGVTLFFAISGFLITSLLVRERDRNARIDLRAFYMRRTLRIFPLYYAVLLLYLALVLVIERHTEVGQQFLQNFPYFLTYTSNWFVSLDGRTIFYFAWSLAAEEQFYLVWPAVLVAMKTNSRSLALLALGISVLVCIEWLARPSQGASGGLHWIASRIPMAILFGAAAALALHSPRGFRLLAPLVAGRGASAAWLAVVALALVTPEIPRFVLHAALAALVVACVVNRRHWLAAPLAWRPLAYLGTISYGMYLLHMLAKNLVVKVLGMVTPEPHWLLVFASTTMFATLMASLSFRYFESFFLSRKRQFER